MAASGVECPLSANEGASIVESQATELAIARQVVELHGGSIQAKSLGSGQGATFTVEFPRSPVTDAPWSGRVYSQAERSVGLEVLLSDIEMPGTDGY
jgi:hypothetical protein